MALASDLDLHKVTRPLSDFMVIRADGQVQAEFRAAEEALNREGKLTGYRYRFETPEGLVFVFKIKIETNNKLYPLKKGHDYLIEGLRLGIINDNVWMSATAIHSLPQQKEG